MIEKTMLDLLAKKLDCPVVLERRPDLPERFVLIEKTGSSRINRIDSAVFAIQSYAATMYEAALLNEQVKDTLLHDNGINEIVSITLNSDYNFTDTTTKEYRYQAVFNIVHY